jgi:NDP-sugar pyrophosphorylase family protein
MLQRNGRTNDNLQTLTYPKPLVEFANKPMIQHQIEALAAAGVTDVVLAVNYRPEIMAEALKTVSISVPLQLRADE